MRAIVRGVGILLGLVTALLFMATADAASIVVSPASVPVGGTVTVSGDVLGPGGTAGCALPGGVTLISGAFAGQGSFMNMDVAATAGADGKFSVQATILAGVAPGTYTITGRCGGGNLGVQATLVVTAAGLPATGSAGLLAASTAGRPAGAPAVALLAAFAAMAMLAAGLLLWRKTTL